MKQLLLFFFFIAPFSLAAQTPYEIALKKGQDAYNQGDYANAAIFWEKGKSFSGADQKKLNTLIWRTRDDDGDGFVNGRDKCPKTYYTSNGGCPPAKPKDRDEDGIPDVDDRCPDHYGPLKFKGCPDKDGDETPDHLDACPQEFGPKRTSGCPDRDGDEVADKDDDCPDEAGPTATKGCPDTDGDGVPDKDDDCPKQKGTRANKGCPVIPPAPVDPAPTVPAGMVLVRGGTFTMGSTEASDEQPLHSVTVSDFYMGKYEVTNAEFVKFLNVKGNQTEGGATWINLEGSWEGEKCRIYLSGSTFKVESGYENYPVIYVSWYGATAYCQWLGSQYRLPTEAEWEYAAGNGSRHTKYSWGNGDPSGKKGGNVSDQTAKAKFSSWSAFENYTDGYIYTAPVGHFDANEFGLYDMSGNVWEWCSDWYDAEYYKNSPSKDPKGPSTAKDYRVLRGGSWISDPEGCRVAYRFGSVPYSWNSYIGFRVVRGY